jgi:hypothetical protein
MKRFLIPPHKGQRPAIIVQSMRACSMTSFVTRTETGAKQPSCRFPVNFLIEVGRSMDSHQSAHGAD